MTILVSGFVGYADNDRNPSELLAREFDGCLAGQESVVGRVLPVSHRRTAQALRQALTELEPDAVLMLGLFPSRPQLTIERVAINVLDYPFPDNDGEQPVDEPIVAEGPAAYLSTLDVREVIRAWEAAGISGHLSYTAGTYVCNESFYVALDATASRALPVGLIHLPSLEGANTASGTPGMSLQAMAEGVSIALEAVARTLARSRNSVSSAAVAHGLQEDPGSVYRLANYEQETECESS
jgi:pyroglutamyl-peptidase